MTTGRAVPIEAQRIRSLEEWRTDNINPWRVAVDESRNGVDRWRGGVNAWQADTENWKNKHNNILDGLPEFENQVKSWKTDVEIWKTDTNTWRNKHNDNLDSLPGFERDVTNSLQNLTTSGRDHSAQLRDFDQFTSKISPRVANLEGWRGKTDSHLDALFRNKLNVATYKTAADELEEYKKGADMKLESLDKNTVNVKIYNENQIKCNNELIAVSRKTDWLKDLYTSAIPPMEKRLDSLEGRTKDLETKVTRHNDEIIGIGNEFSKVRQEIKVSHTQLGDRIVGHHNKIDKSLRKLEGMLVNIHGGSGSPSSGESTAVVPPKPESGKEKGKENGKENGKGDGNGGGDTGAEHDNGNQNNKCSPGSINVSNYGQLSVQHAPNCTRFIENFKSNTNTLIRCPCKTQGTQLGTCGPSSGPWSPSLGPWGPSPGPFSNEIEGVIWHPPNRGLLPSHFLRRSVSDLREGSSNFNYTPNISLGLTRHSGGGLFSKPKKEEMVLELGRVGGGGASGRRKEKDRKRMKE